VVQVIQAIPLRSLFALWVVVVVDRAELQPEDTEVTARKVVVGVEGAEVRPEAMAAAVAMGW
jgi:hypothetical protein